MLRAEGPELYDAEAALRMVSREMRVLMQRPLALDESAAHETPAPQMQNGRTGEPAQSARSLLLSA